MELFFKLRVSQDMFIILQGIGKILFVSVLKINGRLHKQKLNFSEFAQNFSCEKVNFNLIHPTHVTIHSL